MLNLCGGVFPLLHVHMVKEWLDNLNFHLYLAPPFLKLWPDW